MEMRRKSHMLFRNIDRNKEEAGVGVGKNKGPEEAKVSN